MVIKVKAITAMLTGGRHRAVWQRGRSKTANSSVPHEILCHADPFGAAQGMLREASHRMAQWPQCDCSVDAVRWFASLTMIWTWLFMVGTRRTVYSSPDVHRHLRPAAVPGQARAKAYRLHLLRKDRRGCFVGPDIVTPISSPRETAVGCMLCTVLLPHAIPGLCSQRLSEKGLSWRYGPGAGVPA
jgi:hypothetical protein